MRRFFGLAAHLIGLSAISRVSRLEKLRSPRLCRRFRLAEDLANSGADRTRDVDRVAVSDLSLEVSEKPLNRPQERNLRFVRQQMSNVERE
jgi:hypothetical protein